MCYAPGGADLCVSGATASEGTCLTRIAGMADTTCTIRIATGLPLNRASDILVRVRNRKDLHLEFTQIQFQLFGHCPIPP